MADEELEKRLAHIEERAIRLERSRPGIAPGGDEQSGQPDQDELRVEALLHFLEAPGGITEKADAAQSGGETCQQPLESK
jgi:hypothetical protein